MYLNTEFKMNGKNAFRRNYWPCVGATLVVSLLTGGGTSVASNASDVSSLATNTFSGSTSATDHIMSIPTGLAGMAVSILGVVAILAVLFSIFVSNVMEVGGDRFFIQNRDSAPTVGTIFDGFKSGNYLNIVKTMFLKDLYTFLWTLLLIIPGIVKSFEYLMVPYILAENPGMDSREAFALSKQMMDGEKANAFMLGLSFIGWYILTIITCGIAGVFYVYPYVYATYAELYAYNKEKAFQQGWIH